MLSCIRARTASSKLWDRVESKQIERVGQKRFLFDLQQEQAGFLELELISAERQKIVIAYGEHLRKGHVARRIGERDFSVEYICRPGKNHYMNPFRRLGCRYLEIFCEAPAEISYAGIRPTMYPLRRTDFVPSDPLDRQIYQICVRSLELCLHEHYEDLPVERTGVLYNGQPKSNAVRIHRISGVSRGSGRDFAFCAGSDRGSAALYLLPERSGILYSLFLFALFHRGG